MIKTLRITGIIVAVLAAFFIVLPAVLGVRSDEQAEQFLNSAGAIEKFNEARGDKAKDSESQASPLVKQAEAFALYLNPPPESEKATAPRNTRAPLRPRTVSTKFKLIGTSFYASHPEMSLALIDEPGKGLHWVRQSGKVGHLIIEQIKDGLVVVRDDKRTFELTPERTEKRSILKRTPPGTAGSKSILPVLDKAGTSITRTKPPDPVNEENAALMDKFISDLRVLQVRTNSGKIDRQHSAKEREEMAEKLMSNLKSIRISTSEAERLDHLGEELKDIRQDPNQARERIARRKARVRRPTKPDKK